MCQTITLVLLTSAQEGSTVQVDEKVGHGLQKRLISDLDTKLDQRLATLQLDRACCHSYHRGVPQGRVNHTHREIDHTVVDRDDANVAPAPGQPQTKLTRSLGDNEQQQTKKIKCAFIQGVLHNSWADYAQNVSYNFILLFSQIISEPNMHYS